MMQSAQSVKESENRIPIVYHDDFVYPFGLLGIDADIKEKQMQQVTPRQAAAQYLGFDTKDIAARYYARAAERPVGAHDKVLIANLRYGQFKVYEKNDKMGDLIFLVALFLEWGHYVSKTFIRSYSNTAAIIQRKCAVYSVQMEYTRIQKTSRPTLPSLALTFAPVTALVIQKYGIEGKFVSKLFKTPLPKVMQHGVKHTIFAGLIPSNIPETENLRFIACILRMEMKLRLGSLSITKVKMGRRAMVDLLKDAKKYVDAVMETSLSTETIKMKCLVKTGILTFKVPEVESGSAAQPPPEPELIPTEIYRALVAELPEIKSKLHLTYFQALAQEKEELKDLTSLVTPAID